MKNILKYVISILSTILFFHSTDAQVSKFDKVKKEGIHIYNYLPGTKKYQLKKSKDIRIVYSDRSNNISYYDPYAQKKYGRQKLFQSFFIIGEKNNSYELVLEDKKVLGKPKGLFGLFMGSKYRFSDPKAPVYVGWIPKSHILNYGHSFLDNKNNSPLKYKIGVQDINNIFKLQSYFTKDSVYIYTDPRMQSKANFKLANNQVVYPYKYSKTKKTVLVSNFPQVKKNDKSQIFGWLPSDLIVPVQHQNVYRLKTSKAINLISSYDTISLTREEVYSDYLYRNSVKSDQSVIVPFYIWDHSKNKLINIKGNNLPYSEVFRMGDEQNIKNIHLIVSHKEISKLKAYIGSLQSIWLTLEKYQYTNNNFSFASVGSYYNYFFQKKSSFAEWIDYIKKVLDGKAVPNNTSANNTEDIIYKLLEKNNQHNFEDNIFLIMGSTEEILFKRNPKIMKLLASNNSKLLFIQINNSIANKYQNFILGAKNIMHDIGQEYNSFIQNYMVDNGLIVKHNTSIKLDFGNDNIYIYDAPRNSLYNGGIVFPGINQYTTPASVDVAIDSVLHSTKKTNRLLLQSLKNYQKKLGTLRSELSKDIVRLISKTTSTPIGIGRNTMGGAVYQKCQLLGVDTIPEYHLTSGVLLTKSEIVAMIEGYRALLPNFSSKKLNKKNKRILKKMYKKQRKAINKAYHRKVLRMKDPISKLFFYKVRVPLRNRLIGNIPLRKITRKTQSVEYMNMSYFNLLKKVDTLEKLLRQKKLEKNDEGEYFVPIQYLL